MEIIESSRICELEEELSATPECRKIDARIDALFSEIESYLPSNKKHVICEVEDCFTEILILHEEYFYKKGYLDNIKRPAVCRLFKRVISWFRSFRQ